LTHRRGSNASFGKHGKIDGQSQAETEFFERPQFEMAMQAFEVGVPTIVKTGVTSQLDEFLKAV